MQSLFVQKTADVAGAIFSQLCLVHCLMLPLLLAFIPALPVSDFFAGEAFHFGVLCLATPITTFALWNGYRNHGCPRAMIFGFVALAALWLVHALEGTLNHDLASAFSVTGGMMMAWAHWQNWSLTKERLCCSH